MVSGPGVCLSENIRMATRRVDMGITYVGCDDFHESNFYLSNALLSSIQLLLKQRSFHLSSFYIDNVLIISIQAFWFTITVFCCYISMKVNLRTSEPRTGERIPTVLG